MVSASAGPGGRPPKPDIMNQMVLMLVFIVAIFIMFDQNLRQSLGAAVGVVLEPVVGFHGHNAVLTLFFTGLLMGFFSIVVRHFFVDWIEQARIARITSAFQKEFREARLTNNTYKIKKMTELQPQIMSQSLKTSQTQMKLMPVTMLVIIPVFAWLANFVYLDLPSTMLSVPWSLDVNMQDSSVLPNWVLLYSLLTLPFTQVLQKSLKFFSFRKRLEKLETEGEKPKEE
ncbi:MAG: EMC3/TMCO1 family protein [Thermoplasmata archaeon]|jgi:uncharacterized membrane protein (DUF106 family)|nr:EMC3/TMCO1 family protein [Thermoplasmata archaeon]